MKLRHVISAQQFSEPGVLAEIFKEARALEDKEAKRIPSRDCEGKILACVFYEPSTRTRLSFETAMYRLGGDVITSESAAQFSSASKGESLSDAMKVISGYADAIVLRHPEEGSAKVASEASLVPVVNAGDGTGEHPTQAMLDLYTIDKEMGRINGLTIGFMGDLLYGRTVHSLLYLLPLYPNVKIYFISPSQLQLPKEYKRNLKQHHIVFNEFTDLKDVAPELDVLYVTRIQKERFASPAAYEKLKGSYVIDSKILKLLKKEMIIMHPLPRVNEIAPEVDEDVRAAYFRQVQNGIYVRMALLKSILT